MMHFDLGIEEDYFLIGIHTDIEAFKLAYLINKNLKYRFVKASFELDFKDAQSKFSVFEYDDENKLLTYYLISNKYIGTSVKKTQDLFSEIETVNSLFYLIPEKKKVDYFLKIDGEISPKDLQEIILKINEIEQIKISYEINPYELKSKDNLIF